MTKNQKKVSLITLLTLFLNNGCAFAADGGIKFSIIILKFLIAMLGVLISAFAVWLGLKIYKEFILKNSSKSDSIDYEKTLESPKDFKEAINLFLDKTDKN